MLLFTRNDETVGVPKPAGKCLWAARGHGCGRAAHDESIAKADREPGRPQEFRRDHADNESSTNLAELVTIREIKIQLHSCLDLPRSRRAREGFVVDPDDARGPRRKRVPLALKGQL